MDRLNIYISEIESKRDSIIASCIENNQDGILENLELLIDLVNPEISENDMKAVNQTLHCIRFFRKKSAHLFNHKLMDFKNELSRKNASILKDQIKRDETTGYDTWIEKTGLNDKALKRVMENLSSLQITTGCSNYCRRCNEWALPFPRKHFDFEAVKKFLLLLLNTGNRDFNLYSASDPLDFKSGDYDITDIEKFLKEIDMRSSFGILTKVPRGKEEILKKLMDLNSDIGISITERNRNRVKKVLEGSYNSVFKQHELDELTIPAGLDEDFSSIKPSITDIYGIEITTDGVFQIVPTFTSALSLTGQARIPVTKESRLFIKKVTGRRALSVQYFKPLTFVDLDGADHTLKHLLDPQIENIILDRSNKDADPPGMMNLREFFKIFDRKAVRTRKKISKKVLKDAEMKTGDSLKFELFKHQYLRSCDTKECSQMKIDAVIYLLTEVKDYILRNPDRIKIARHLRREDLKEISVRFKRFFVHGIEKTFLKEPDNSFTPFEILLLMITGGHENPETDEFLKSRKVIYDTVTGYFVRES